MGMIAPALATLAALLAGALVTAWLESRLVPRNAEAGPATPVRMRADLRPQNTDPWMYAAGPVVALLGVCWAMVVIPFGPELVGRDLGVGFFYFLVVVDFVVLGIALAGWGGNAPGSVEACYRVVAQLIAYVVPLGLAILGPIMMARSLSTVDIVEAQRAAGFWYVLVQPLGFALYVVCALMQVYRAPFLEPFAARIHGGVLGFCGGWQGLVWRIALSGVFLVVAAAGAVLFLGGYASPLGETAALGPGWMALKTVGMIGLMTWVGRRVRLLSTAEMLALSWKVLIPLGLVNVLVVGGLILLGVGQEPFAGAGASPGGGR